MRALEDYLRRLPPVFNFAAGMVLLAVIWRLDRLAPPQVGTAIFYLIPIAFVSWFAGWPWSYLTAILAAVLAGLTAFRADALLGRTYAYSFIPYWNALVRFGYYLVVPALSRVMERLRRLNDVEREASQMKSDMVALVSHEFGNSLTTMRLALSLLKESKGETAEEERAEHYAVLERVIAHLSAATSNFLNLNRLHGGQFRPQFRLTRMRSVAREALVRLEPVIESRNVTLHLDLPAVGVPVRADPDAMAVVMSNLIGNAFKYTPDGGSVTIRITIDKAEPAAALVSVEDTGIGIPPEEQEKIMAEGYRTRAAARVARGYGVGLSVVSELLASQGSKLEVESQVGKGSRFFFRLPMWDESAA